jgi:hypothetical protein
MKIPTTPSVRRADVSSDVTLNPVELSSKEIVSHCVSRRAPGTLQRVAETATIGSVLGTAGSLGNIASSD